MLLMEVFHEITNGIVLFRFIMHVFPSSFAIMTENKHVYVLKVWCGSHKGQFTRLPESALARRNLRTV